MSTLARIVVAAALAYTALTRALMGGCPDCRGTGVVALTVCNRCGGLGRRMSGQEGWPR